jgi:hypothetical protein
MIPIGVQVGEVELAWEWSLRQFVGTCRNEGSFGLFEPGCVVDAAAIS